MTTAVSAFVQRMPPRPIASWTPIDGISWRSMDYLKLFADQERQGFPDLAGSEGQGAIRVLVDIRAVLAPHGLTLLDYIKDIAVGTEEGRLVVAFAAGVRGLSPV